MDRNALARKLRELRVDAGLSQQVLGARLERPQSYVSKIENAERRVELHEIEEWAQATGKTMYWTFVDRDAAELPADASGAATASAADADVVASVAWLLPRLGAADRALLQNTVRYLLERLEKERR